MEHEEYSYVINAADETSEAEAFPERIINFKRRKIQELEKELQHENLEGEIIILDTNIALKPETLQVHLKEEDDTEIQDDQNVFEDTNFVDVDGNTYKLLETEVEEAVRVSGEYIELNTDLEEGEVRDADTELFRKQFIINDISGRFLCPMCDRPFSQKGNLIRHYQTHTGDKPFICKLCGHKFTQKSNLQKHLDTHNGQKRYECGLCKKGFVQKANLIRHLRIHTGEKPFRCDLCGHKFTQKGNLNKHMQLHTTETECVCDYCDCKFSSYTLKMRHETSIHSDKSPEYEEEDEPNMNQCDECPATFRTKRALMKHRKFHK